MINKTDLRVIEGGIRPKEECEKRFISSYVTDTRLMGAMGLFIRWEVVNCAECDELMQFFYLDTEEYGLENYFGIWGYDMPRMRRIERTTIDCLGGKQISLTEKEACSLVAHYHNLSIKWNVELPKEWSEYQFVLDRATELNQTEHQELVEKICTPMVSDIQVANYYMMRVFGKDFDGASYIYDNGNHNNHEESVSDTSIHNLFPEFPPCTMFRNSVTGDNGAYLCESLINDDFNYYICTTELNISDGKVIYAKPLSSFQVSHSEAALILSRREFISVYDVSEDEVPPSAALELDLPTTCTFYPNGKLLMVFKNNNDHVKEPVFLLNNDIYGTYFITPLGQFVVSAYTAENIRMLENSLTDSSIGPYLDIAGKFTFREPVINEFIGSDFFDFIDFMDAMDL